MNLFVGCVETIREGPLGREAVVSVRGARVEILLDAVPEARVGDSVLIHAGVALSVLSEGTEPEARGRTRDRVPLPLRGEGQGGGSMKEEPCV